MKEKQSVSHSTSTGRYRLIATIGVIAGLALLALQWHHAMTEGYYYQKFAVLCPFLLVVALHEAMFPQARNQIKGMKFKNWRDIPLRYRYVLGLGIVAGFLNLILIGN